MRCSGRVRRAENLSKARPHVLIMPDGVGLSVFQSQCAQPEIGSRGATHEEEEVSGLGVIHPRDTLEENLLLCGFVLQEGAAARSTFRNLR